MKRLLWSVSLLVLLCLAAVSRAYPGIVVCALATSGEYTAEQAMLIQASRARLESHFGPLTAEPVTTFFDTPDAYWPLQPNTYGSTSFIGHKTCVLIGPNGQNIDVTAHELMHAEIAARMGYWRRARELPIWLDEGLAMQVDFRERYNLEANQQRIDVQTLSSAKAFFVADDAQLTLHYASAKAAAQHWLDQVGKENLFEILGDEQHAAWESETVLIQ